MTATQTDWTIAIPFDVEVLETKEYGTITMGSDWKPKVKEFVDLCKFHQIEIVGAYLQSGQVNIYFASEADFTAAMVLL